MKILKGDSIDTLIKKGTLKFLKQHRPFQYMYNLSHLGYQNHKVSSKESFNYGVNYSLDWYNYYKKDNSDLKTEFYALSQGAKAITRYILTNMERKK